MNVVDSSGWLEYFADGANADFFALPIEDPDNLVTPTICIFEVFKRMLLDFGDERALDGIGIMSENKIVDLNRQIAQEAAILSVETKLAMADSIILATARAYEATLWTQDAHFEGLEGVRYIDRK